MSSKEIKEDTAHIDFEEGGDRKLVASRNIFQGEVIVTLPSVTQPEPDKYSIEVSPGVHIRCDESLAGAINHSCVPNAVVRRFRVVAWSCLEPGDEILIDYRRTEQKLAFPFKCSCGHCEGDYIS